MGRPLIPMNKIDQTYLKTHVEKTRTRLLDAIAPLTHEQWIEPEIIEGLSVEELFHYLGLWQEAVNKGLREIQRRKKPTVLMNQVENHARFRQKSIDEWVIYGREDILNKLEDAYWQLEVRIENFSMQDLNDPQRFRFFGNQPLWPFIAQITYEHEARFIPMLEAYATRVKAD